MKISFEAFLKEQTVLEFFLRAILTSYNQLKLEGKIDMPFDDPFNELLKDVLKGRADLKLVVWFKNRRLLEDELGLAGRTYKDLYFEFIQKEIKKICMSNSSIDLFKDFDRCNDFFESVQKTMDFYIKYKLIKIRD